MKCPFYVLVSLFSTRKALLVVSFLMFWLLIKLTMLATMSYSDVLVTVVLVSIMVLCNYQSLLAGRSVPPPKDLVC